jgi:hypothetical protein
MISIVLALPTKKVFYFFKYRDIANAVILWVFFQGRHRESGIGKVLRSLPQWPQNMILRT